MSLRSNSTVKWPKSGASFQSQQLAYSDRQQLAMKGGGKSHSWWWDSHISPKNSKWLEDNLSEMDAKVKAMLRLIEEDADSFAKRAEMYYKKRPELTALVEEFYRAYRALAERYDQLTGDIRQNVPNMQAQFGLTGDSAPASPLKSKGPKRAAGFSVFLSPGTPTRSKEKYDKDNNGRSSSSSSDSESDSKSQREGEEIQQLLMEIEQLKENLNKSELDQNSLQTQLNELQEELNLLHKEKSRIHEEKSNLQNEVFSGVEQVRTLKAEVKHFQEAIEISEVDKEKGIALRVLLEKNLEELRTQLSTLQDEKRKLSDDVLRGCDQVRALEEQGTELNRLIDTMKSEQAAADANRRKLESDIDMLMKQKASLADERLLNFDQIKRLEEEQQDMLSNSEERERHVLELEQQLQKLGQDLLYSKQEHASHLELSETWKGKNNELKVELSRLEENNSKLVTELTSKTELILQLDTDVKRLQDVVVAVQDENAKSSSDLQIALTHASTVEKKCLQQEEMLVQLQEHRDKLSVEFAEMCRQRQEIWDFRSVLLVEKSELDVQVKELYSRNSRLQEEIQQMRTSNEDLSERVQRGIEENQALETNIQGLTEQLSSSKLNEEEKINALMMEISELKIEISRLKLELSRRSAELKSLEEQREVWTLEKSRFQGDIDQLNEEKRGFQSSLVEWTEHKLKLELNHQTLEKRSREVEDNLVFHQAENSRIQSEISVRTERVTMLEQELMKMQEALSASQEEIQTLSSNMEKEKQALEERFEAEVDKVRVMEESVQKLQVALLSAQKETETVTDACKVHVKEFEMREAILVSQISNLDNEIRRFDEESKELIRRLQDKSLQQEELEREILKLQQSLSSAQQEREIVEADRDRQMQEFVQEREIRIKVEEACGKLNIEAKDLHVEINHLQVELQRLRNENQELKQHSEISTKQQQKVELDIEKLLLALQNAHENESFPVDEYKWHTGELLPKRLSLRNVEEKIHFLLAQRENRKRDHVAHTGRLKDLEEELKRRTHLYEVLREDYDALAAKHENVSKEFQVLHSQIPQLEQKIVFLEEENKKLREELLMKVKLFDETFSVLEREKMELHEKLQIEKEMLSAEVLREKVQEKETQKLHQQLEEAEAKIKTLIESSRSLSHKHEMAVNELQALQLKFADLNDENVRLGREALSRSVSITELQELVSGIEKRKAEMESEAKSREEHFIVFEEKVRTLQDENDQLDQKLKSGTEELRIVNEEILRLRQLHLDFQNENESLKVDKQRSFDESSLVVIKFESLQKDLFDQQTSNTHLETELKKGEARIEELEGEIVKYQNEKQALTVEIASSAVTMNSLQTQLDSLEEEVKQLRNELKIGGEQLLQKNEEIENVNSSLEGLRGENLGLNEELKKKILDYGRVESALNALEEERLSLQDINKKLSEAVASGVGVIDSLKKEAEQLLSEKYVLDQQVVEMSDQIQMLQKRCLMLQQTEQQLRDMVEVKEEEIRKLEEEVRKLNFTSFSVTQEKEKVAAELRLGIHRYVALENLFKSLQQDLIERSEQKSKANAVSSFMEKLTREVVGLKERLGHLQDGLSSKQGEMDGVQRKNDELYDGVRERDDEVRTLREQLQVVREEHSSVQDELSIKVWFLHEIELTFKSLRETKVIFEGGRAVEIGEANLVQEEVTKLIQKVTKLSEVVRMSEEKMERLEITVHKLQIGNVNLKEDVLRLGEKEKSYVIAVRFMRAEFFCLVQRVRELKEEKEAALINVQRELDFLREEVKRQRAVIMDRGEEKRQAIKQLCLALEFSQEKTVRLEQMIRSLKLVVHDRPGRGGCCLPV